MPSMRPNLTVCFVYRLGMEMDRNSTSSQMDPYSFHGGSFLIFAKDSARALRMSKSVRAGIVWVNTYRAVSPIAEFGGMKNSGYGRESGFQAVYDYTRPKTVWMNMSSEPLGSQFVSR